MEYRIVRGYGKYYGIVFWYNPNDGRIITWNEFKKLKKEERKQFIKAGRFFKDSHPLAIAYCPLHKTWERLEVLYSKFYEQALKKANNCEEYNRFKSLWMISQMLAKDYLKGLNSKEEILKSLKRWVKCRISRNDDKVLVKLTNLTIFFPELAEQINAMKEEASLKLMAKRLSCKQ